MPEYSTESILSMLRELEFNVKFLRNGTAVYEPNTSIAKLSEKNYSRCEKLLDQCLHIVKNDADLPSSYSKDIHSKLTNSLSLFKDIRQEVDNTYISEKTLGRINTGLAFLNETLEQLRKLSSPIEVSLSPQKDDFEKTLNQLATQIKDISESIDVKIQDAVNQKHDNNNIQTTIQTNVLKEIDILTQAESSSAHNWLFSGITFLGSSLLYAFLFLVHPPFFLNSTEQALHFTEKVENYLLIKNSLRDFFILTCLSTAALICFKQHKKHKINHTLYKHKKFSLSTFERLASNTMQADTRNIIVEKAMSAIFLPPDRTEEKAGESTNNFINAIRAFPPNGNEDK